MCREMRPPGHHHHHHHPHRINLDDLKNQIVEKLGPELSKQYFYYLNRFFNYKISKDDFNKVCLRVIGRDNVPLHNRLFQSIIKNAYGSKIPPPTTTTTTNKQLEVPRTSNAVRNREIPDRNKKTGGSSYPIIPNGKTNNVTTQQPLLTNNGYLKPFSTPSTANLKENSSAWSSLKAPLGVPLCSGSVGGARQTAAVSNSVSLSSSEMGVLLDSIAVKKRMEQIALAQGLEGGVSADCANLLKTGLDSYLKNLISSCVQLNARPQMTPSRYMNGLIHNRHVHHHHHHRSMQNSNRVGSISLQNFRVAMELNPIQLGQDWPILLERICNRSFINND